MEEPGADDDLATATVRHLTVERGGSRLTALLQLVVDRGFAVEEPAPPALLNVWLDRVGDVDFVPSGTGGVTLDAGSREIRVFLDGGGLLRAAGGECHLDDRSWHLSAAGRRADAVTLLAPAGPVVRVSRPAETWDPTRARPPRCCVT
ncbi:hypothetical protein [Streptomyces sp. NRRL F-5727]|uniref:hypothetical protein n=1 Tax=Streptomyces sp. NRRL F-5727 TaxID=1463871 RepID=UPI0004CBA64A|nr:hypothetical protein [Streptomyces sp. NRRL F-5727]